MYTDIKVQIVEFGNVMRDTNSKIVGVFPTEDEAYEMLNLLLKEVEEDGV